MLKRQFIFLCLVLSLCVLVCEPIVYKADTGDGVDESKFVWYEFGNDCYKLEDSICSDFEYVLPSDIISSFDYWCVFRNVSTGKYTLLTCNMPFALSMQTNGVLSASPNFLESGYVPSAYKGACYSSDDGLTWDYVRAVDSAYVFQVTAKEPYRWIEQLCESNYWIFNCNAPSFSASSSVFYYFWQPSTRFVEGEHDSNLGYLKNVDARLLYLNDENGNRIDNSGLYQILFDSTSTSGVDLTDDSYYIRLFGQVAIYDKNWENVCPNMPLIEIGNYGIADNPTRTEFVEQNFFDAVTDGTGSDVIEEIYTFWNMQVNGYLRRDTMYLQICRTNDDGSISYGGFTRLACSKVDYATLENTYTIDTITPSLEDDNSGYSGLTDTSDIASGSDFNDAMQDLEDSSSTGGTSDIEGVGNLTSAIKELASFVGDFPLVIDSCLSFLPVWCRLLIYGAFGIGAVLLVIAIIT